MSHNDLFVDEAVITGEIRPGCKIEQLEHKRKLKNDEKSEISNLNEI